MFLYAWLQTVKMMKLGQICSLSIGYTARRRLEVAGSGGWPAVQLRDVEADVELESGRLRRYAFEDLPERCIARGGEVIFRSRGVRNTAAVVSRQLAEPVAIILPLVILRPRTPHVLPAYLAWTINRPQAQRYFHSEAQGTSLRMIRIRVLERLEVPVPDMFTQQRIVSAHGLARRERLLLGELGHRRQRLFSAVLEQHAHAAPQQEIPR